MFGWPDVLIALGASQDDAANFRTTIFLALAVGAAAVLLDSITKYDQRTEDFLPFAGSSKVRPSMLASSLAHRQSFLLYIVMRLGVFLLVAIGLPLVLQRIDLVSLKTYSELAFGAVENVRAVSEQPYWPAIWGLASAGVLDSIPFLKRLEPALRRIALTFAFVPHGVTIIKRQITLSPFRLSEEHDGGRAVNRFLRAVETDDFSRNRSSLEHRWARLASILYLLEPSNRDGLRSRFIEEYRALIVELEEDFRGLETRMRLYRRSQTGGLTDPTLLEEVRDSLASLPGDVDRALDKAEFVLACAIPTAQTPGRKSADKLRNLGFEVEKTELDTFGNVFVSVLVVAFAAFFGALVSHFLTLGLSGAMGDMLVYPDPDAPQSRQANIFSRALNMLIYSVAILGVLFLMTFSLGRRVARIDAVRPHPAAVAEKPMLDYAVASLVGATAAAAVMIAMVFALAPAPDPSTADAAPAISVGALAIWAPRLFVLCFMAQILVYGPTRTTQGMLAWAGLLGAIDLAVTFVTAIAFFEALGRPEPVTLGGAIYLSIVSFAITTCVLFIYARLSHRQRALLLAAEPIAPGTRRARPVAVAA